jgi:hypothetical protein
VYYTGNREQNLMCVETMNSVSTNPGKIDSNREEYMIFRRKSRLMADYSNSSLTFKYNPLEFTIRRESAAVCTTRSAQSSAVMTRIPFNH